MNPATSTSVLPTPTRASAKNAGSSLRPRSYGGDRESPEQRADHERNGETSSTDQRHDDDGPQQATDPHRCVEQANATLPELEEAQRGDDDEDVDAAGRERLPGEHPGEQPQVRRPPGHAEPTKQVLSQRRVLLRARQPLRLLDREDDQRRPQQRGCHQRKRSLETRYRKDEARQRRADEHPEPLDRGRDDVRHRQLFGSPGELRQHSHLCRTEGCADHRHEPGEQVHERERRIRRHDRSVSRTSTARTRSLANITRTLGYRSPSAAAGGVARAPSVRRTNIPPTAAAPPAS